MRLNQTSSRCPISFLLISVNRCGMWRGGRFPEDINTLCLCVCSCVFVCVFCLWDCSVRVGLRPRIDLGTAAILQPHPCVSDPSVLSRSCYTPLPPPGGFLTISTRSSHYLHTFFSSFCPPLFTRSPTPPCPFVLNILPSFPPLFPFSPPPAEKVTPRHKHHHPPFLLPDSFSPSLFLSVWPCFNLSSLLFFHRTFSLGSPLLLLSSSVHFLVSLCHFKFSCAPPSFSFPVSPLYNLDHSYSS